MRFEYVGDLSYVSKQKDAIEGIAMMIVDRLDDAFKQHHRNWEQKFDRKLQKDASCEWTVYIAGELNKWLNRYINIYLDNLFVITLPSVKYGYIFLFGFKRHHDCMFYTVWEKGDIHE